MHYLTNMLITIIIPALNEGENIGKLINSIKEKIAAITNDYEIIVVDGQSNDATVENATKAGATVIVQKQKGFGNALKEGFKCAKGDYVITIDGDLSHNPDVIDVFWKERETADILIGSRYVTGGSAEQSILRKILSRTLNNIFAKGLSIPFKDLSSNLRMYRHEVLNEIKITGINFDALQEILIQAFSKGFEIKEVPMQYRSREWGVSKSKMWTFAKTYLKTFLKLWNLRNSTNSCDYDSRAYTSIIPLQRYWQRKRYKKITKIVNNNSKILDAGCGTSKIIQNLPQAIALDILFNKLRYLKKTNNKRIQASTITLPFKNGVFDLVLSSQVIEHIPYKPEIFKEFRRVLKTNGTLILGTPDYDKTTWNIIEWLYKKIPNTYGDEHITHYNKKSLTELLKQNKFAIKNVSYVCNSELILTAQKID